MKDLTITLPNLVGALAEISKALGEAGVNITGICGSASGGEGVLHLLVENPDLAKQALARTSAIVNKEREVVIWKFGEEGAVGKPGSSGEVCQKLADAGVNIDLVYQGENDILIYGVDNVEVAKSILG